MHTIRRPATPLVEGGFREARRIGGDDALTTCYCAAGWIAYETGYTWPRVRTEGYVSVVAHLRDVLNTGRYNGPNSSLRGLYGRNDAALSYTERVLVLRRFVIDHPDLTWED